MKLKTGLGIIAVAAGLIFGGRADAQQCNSGGVCGTPTQTSVTVGVTTGPLVAAKTFANFMKVCVALGATNGIWVDWSGNAAVAAPPSEYIPPGQCDTWTSQGYLPTPVINAIAAGSVAVTVIGR